MSRNYTESELEAFLEEGLTPDEMARIENQLRVDQTLAGELAIINARRDAGVHTLGEIWRRHRVSCPTREQLGSSLLGALSPELADYVVFHVEKVGCSYCRANLDDMRRQQREADEEVVNRRSKYFQSSAGYLRGE